MFDSLPRIAGLVDFECAARLGSFRLAGLELNKTAGAVSFQVKQIEQRLGFSLFIRHPRRIELTAKGRELVVIVRTALRTLAVGISALQSEDHILVLKVSTTHSLAMKWVAPRLHRFGLLRPDLDVRIEANDVLASLDDGSCDVAIRYMRADAGGLLFRDQLVPVFSPTLGASSLDEALGLPLLREGGSELWLAFLGLNNRAAFRPQFSRGYSHAGLLVQAAAAGHGVALAPYALAFQDIEDGRLMTCACTPLPSRYGYAPILSEASGKQALAQQFTAWLEVETDEMLKSLNGRVRSQPLSV